MKAYERAENRSYTTITRTADEPLAADLELLHADVVLARTDERVGRVEGVILDDAGCVVFFVVRLSAYGMGDRVLVPLAAVEAAPSDAGSAILRLVWSVDQIRAQPVFSDDGDIPHQRWDGSAPRPSKFLPAVPNAVPPGRRINRPMAFRGAMKGGAAGAIAGGLLGFAVGGPVVALATAAFFGAGSSIAGALAGGSRDSAVEAAEFSVEEAPTTAGTWLVRRLEAALQSHDRVIASHLRATPLHVPAEVERAAHHAAR